MSSFQKLFTSPMAMLRVAVALCYIALGVYLVINNSLLYFIGVTYRYLMAVVFILYGAFRLYRAIIDLRNE